MPDLTPVEHDPWGPLVPVDHDPHKEDDISIRPVTDQPTDPMTGFNPIQPTGTATRKNYMIEPTLLEGQTGSGGVPEGAAIDETGQPYWKDTGEKIQVIRRPGVLPFARTPDGVEFALPKVADLAGSLMGGVVAPVKGAGVVLGAGPVRQATETAPAFYSAVEHTLSEIPQVKMTGAQWYNTIKNRPGVKGEELDWRGLSDFLKENADRPVTKTEIDTNLKQNDVKIQDVNKGDTEVKFHDLTDNQKEDVIADWNEGMGTNHSIHNPPEGIDALVEDMIRNRHLEGVTGTATKYANYQLAGGTNYREKLLTLPRREHEAYDEFYDRGAPEGTDPRNIDYQGNHWNESNVLAHMRVTDRMMGNHKSYHIEELQSDWHQQGREQGYIGKPATPETVGTGKVVHTNDDGVNKWEFHDHINDKPFYVWAPDQARAQTNAVNYMNEYMTKVNGGVPEAPFKKTWHEMALKRAIRDAAENGYDRISWTPGEHQSTNPKNMGPFVRDDPATIKADKGQREWYNKIIPDFMNKLGKKYGTKVEMGDGSPGVEDFKELAVHPYKSGWAIAKGDPKDRTYYVVDKFNSKEAAEDALTRMGPKKVYYMDLPQSLKDTALHKGFPLFMHGMPFPVTPVDHDPYEKQKTIIPVEHNPFETLK